MRFIPALSLLAVSFALAQDASLKPSTLFPVGESEVSIVSIDVPESAATSLATLQQAMKARPMEALELALKSTAGEPLPYQTWFGLTKEQYESAINTKMVFNTQEKQKLTIRKLAGDGSVLELSATGTLKPLNGIRVNFRTNKATFPEGVSSVGEIINVTDEQGLGPRQGWTWNLQQGDIFSDNYKTGRLVALLLKDSGKVLLNYQMETSEDDPVELNMLLDPARP